MASEYQGFRAQVKPAPGTRAIWERIGSRKRGISKHRESARRIDDITLLWWKGKLVTEVISAGRLKSPAFCKGRERKILLAKRGGLRDGRLERATEGL